MEEDALASRIQQLQARLPQAPAWQYASVQWMLMCWSVVLKSAAAQTEFRSRLEVILCSFP